MTKNNLLEGTWSFPRTEAAVREFKTLLDKPMTAAEAQDKLYHIFGDDTLFDSLDDSEKEAPESDVRSTVKYHMRRLLKSPETIKDLSPTIVDKLKSVIDMKEAAEKLSFKEFLSEALGDAKALKDDLHEEQLDEAGRVHVLKKPGIKPRGAPEQPARAFDKPGTDRSALPKLGKGKYSAIEFADEGDYISVLVMRNDIEPTYSSKKDPYENYYGISVVFFPNGTIEGETDDPRAKKQWQQDKEKIIAVAKAGLKDVDLPHMYHGLGGRSVKRGKGKLSFDIK